MTPTMLPVVAITILLAFMFAGDFISNKTKGFIPSMLIFVILLCAGAWSGVIPKEIVAIPGFTGGFASFAITMMMVDMGSSISLQQLKIQWRTVVLGVFALAGTGVALLTVGASIFGWQLAAVSAPPIAGGMIATMVMTEAGRASGNPVLIQMPVLIFVVQSIPAFIVVPILLQRAARYFLSIFNPAAAQAQVTSEAMKARVSLASKVPQKYRTPHYFLMVLGIFAVISTYAGKATNNFISPAIFALMFGFIAAEIGVIEKDYTRSANAMGYLLFGSLAFVVSGMANSNPQEILALLPALLGMLAVGIGGMVIFSVIAGKLLKINTPLSICLGMNCLLGFPYNYVLTTEAVKNVASTKEETDFLTENILPSMLVAGMVTVTIGSVIFAGILKNYV